MSLRAFITGIAGFAGSHLADLLLAVDGIEICGVVRSEQVPNIEHVRQRLRLYRGDINDPGFVEAAIAEVKPDLLFHLAGQANVAASWENPAATFAENVLGLLNVLESIRKHSPACKVLVVGSGDEYGLVAPSELPVKETNPLRPNSPYAVSKIAQDMLGFQYFASHKLHVIRVRPFNHIGPRQSDAFAVSSFAKQIALAELGLAEPIVRVGNLEARRDFTDVRDIVRGYWLALQRGEPGEVYNLGSGRAYAIGEVLHLLLAKSNLKISVEQDPLRLRPSDVPVIVCDYHKMKAITAWEPRYSLEESLVGVLDYWREKLSSTNGG